MQTPLLLVCALLSASSYAQVDQVINVGFIFTGEGQYITEGVQPAVQLAVDTINNYGNILNGYELNISYTRDSRCDHSESQRAFLEPELSSKTGPDTIALLGCGCSIATQPVAEISDYWSMIHMSYASASDVLSDRSLFPNFWRTYPAESNLAGSVLSIMKQYNWTQLKILTQDEDIFTSSEEAIYDTLTGNSITVDRQGTYLFSTGDNDTNVLSIPDIFSPEVRIYLLNMYSRHARRVLCAAARARREEFDERFRYEKYVWITLGWYGDDWWETEALNDPIINCSIADVEQFLPYTLGIIGANTADNVTAQTDVQMTAEAFGTELDLLLTQQSLVYEHSAYHAYDAVWALAFAFDQYSSEGGNLANYNRLDGNNVTTEIESYLVQTNFTGVSGEVIFDSVGTRVPDEPKVLKYRDSTVVNNCGESGPNSIERVRIAQVIVENSTSVELQYYPCEEDNTTWPVGIPRDGSPINRTITILLPLVVVYYTLAGLGIAFALVCFFFNCLYRNRKIIKLISPNLNYVIILGCIFLYTSVFFFVFPGLEPFWVTFACHIRLWLQCIGYFSANGVILFKMLRVYYIFNISTQTGSRKKSRIPKDWQLFLGVVCMVGILLPILILVGILGDYKAILVRDVELREQRDDDGSIIHFHNLVCDGPNDLIWIIVLYGYLFLSQVVALFVAFRTRKVEIKALNDYKYIAAITYITTFLLLCLLVVAITLEKFQNADAAVYSGILLLETTVLLALVFIPKMVILYKDPKGERIFQRSMSQAGTILGNTNVENDKSRYLELEEHCKDLEGRLAKSGQVVPTFRPRAESSMKLKSMSLSSVPHGSPLKSPVSATNSIIFSAPSTPTHSQTTSTHLSLGTSDYFTGAERNSSGSGSTENPDV